MVKKMFIEIRLCDPVTYFELFNDGGRYHIETSTWICSANQWTGFYMITASVMKELKGMPESLKYTL